MITPTIGTAAHMASATLRKAICHPLQARMVAQIKNMQALIDQQKVGAVLQKRGPKTGFFMNITCPVHQISNDQ